MSAIGLILGHTAEHLLCRKGIWERMHLELGLPTHPIEPIHVARPMHLAPNAVRLHRNIDLTEPFPSGADPPEVVIKGCDRVRPNYPGPSKGKALMVRGMSRS